MGDGGDKKTVSVQGRPIGPGAAPTVVAEMSANHNGSLERALAIVDAVARSGAHAIKLQTYTADTMTLDIEGGPYTIDDPKSLWHGRSLHELYGEASTPWEWHEAIFARCRELGLIAFSAPFDATAVDFLESLDVPAYKIASFEIVDLPLIRRAAATGKPLILSTGMAGADEIAEAVAAAQGAGKGGVILLKCTSTYPAAPENSHLRTIPAMAERFCLPVGISDHTPGLGASVAAVALGAVLIEKHVTLSRADGGVDAAFSLEPDELTRLVIETEAAWKALGSVRFGPSLAEQGSLQFRRSLIVAQDLAKGDVLDPSNMRALRPGIGLAPKHYDELLGKVVLRDAPRGTAVTWDLVGEKEEA